MIMKGEGKDNNERKSWKRKSLEKINEDWRRKLNVSSC